MINKYLSFILILTFLCVSVIPTEAQSVFSHPIMAKPYPGSSVLDLSESYQPSLLSGIKIFPKEPFRFDFLMTENRGTGHQAPGAGEEGALQQVPGATSQEAMKLVKYFLASLTVPEGDLWVNLSPHEPDRIIPDALGETQMGHDLLAQDYILKKLTASLMHPDGETGKKFWEQIYQSVIASKAKQSTPGLLQTEISEMKNNVYGSPRRLLNPRDDVFDQIPELFNKIWIVPDQVEVYQNNDVAYITTAKLKVMTESDYVVEVKSQDLSFPRRRESTGHNDRYDQNMDPRLHGNDNSQQPVTSNSAKEIIRDIILPVIEHEVNHGKHFAPLRQIFHSMILAKWYESHFKNSIIGQYYVDQNKVSSLSSSGLTRGSSLDSRLRGNDNSVQTINQIYQSYLNLFKSGVTDVIREEYDPVEQKLVTRKYFSGGFEGQIEADFAQTSLEKIDLNDFDLASLNVVNVDLVFEKPDFAKLANVARDVVLKETTLLEQINLPDPKDFDHIFLFADSTKTLKPSYDEPLQDDVLEQLVDFLRKPNHFLIINTGDDFERTKRMYKNLLDSEQSFHRENIIFVTDINQVHAFVNEDGIIEKNTQEFWPIDFRWEITKFLAEAFYDVLIEKLEDPNDSEFSDLSIDEVRTLKKNILTQLDQIKDKDFQDFGTRNGEQFNFHLHGDDDLMRKYFGDFYIYDVGGKVTLDILKNENALFNQQVLKKFEGYLPSEMRDQIHTAFGPTYVDISKSNKLEGVYDIFQYFEKQGKIKDKKNLSIFLGDSGNDIGSANLRVSEMSFDLGSGELTFLSFFMNANIEYGSKLLPHVMIMDHEVNGTKKILKWLKKYLDEGDDDLSVRYWQDKSDYQLRGPNDILDHISNLPDLTTFKNVFLIADSTRTLRSDFNTPLQGEILEQLTEFLKEPNHFLVVNTGDAFEQTQKMYKDFLSQKGLNLQNIIFITDINQVQMTFDDEGKKHIDRKEDWLKSFRWQLMNDLSEAFFRVVKMAVKSGKDQRYHGLKVAQIEELKNRMKTNFEALKKNDYEDFAPNGDNNFKFHLDGQDGILTNLFGEFFIRDTGGKVTLDMVNHPDEAFTQKILDEFQTIHQQTQDFYLSSGPTYIDVSISRKSIGVVEVWKKYFKEKAGTERNLFLLLGDSGNDIDFLLMLLDQFGLKPEDRNLILSFLMNDKDKYAPRVNSSIMIPGTELDGTTNVLAWMLESLKGSLQKLDIKYWVEKKAKSENADAGSLSQEGQKILAQLQKQMTQIKKSIDDKDSDDDPFENIFHVSNRFYSYKRFSEEKRGVLSDDYMNFKANDLMSQKTGFGFSNSPSLRSYQNLSDEGVHDSFRLGQIVFDKIIAQDLDQLWIYQDELKMSEAEYLLNRVFDFYNGLRRENSKYSDYYRMAFYYEIIQAPFLENHLPRLYFLHEKIWDKDPENGWFPIHLTVKHLVNVIDDSLNHIIVDRMYLQMQIEIAKKVLLKNANKDLSGFWDSQFENGSDFEKFNLSDLVVSLIAFDLKKEDNVLFMNSNFGENVVDYYKGIYHVANAFEFPRDFDIRKKYLETSLDRLKKWSVTSGKKYLSELTTVLTSMLSNYSQSAINQNGFNNLFEMMNHVVFSFLEQYIEKSNAYVFGFTDRKQEIVGEFLEQLDGSRNFISLKNNAFSELKKFDVLVIVVDGKRKIVILTSDPYEISFTENHIFIEGIDIAGEEEILIKQNTRTSQLVANRTFQNGGNFSKNYSTLQIQNVYRADEVSEAMLNVRNLFSNEKYVYIPSNNAQRPEAGRLFDQNGREIPFLAAGANTKVHHAPNSNFVIRVLDGAVWDGSKARGYYNSINHNAIESNLSVLLKKLQKLRNHIPSIIAYGIVKNNRKANYSYYVKAGFIKGELFDLQKRSHIDLVKILLKKLIDENVIIHDLMPEGEIVIGKDKSSTLNEVSAFVVDFDSADEEEHQGYILETYIENFKSVPAIHDFLKGLRSEYLKFQFDEIDTTDADELFDSIDWDDIKDEAQLNQSDVGGIDLNNMNIESDGAMLDLDLDSRLRGNDGLDPFRDQIRIPFLMPKILSISKFKDHAELAEFLNLDDDFDTEDENDLYARDEFWISKELSVQI